MSNVFPIILNDARWAAQNPVLAQKRKPAFAWLPVVTVGEVVPIQLWFYDGELGSASLANVRKDGATWTFAAKIIRKDAAPLLVATTEFSEIQDARGDYGYAGSLDLLTDELKTALSDGNDSTAFVDIKINGVRTHQFKLPIRPRTYAGTELDTHPAAEGLLEEMQAAAAEADADAAAASAAKVAAEGFRDEAQGFRNEAEGFKNESEAARDASQGFRNEAEGFKNDAEAARDAAATSEGNAATSESNAAASAADAEASRLAIITAAFRTDIVQNFTLAQILQGQANAGLLGKGGVQRVANSYFANNLGTTSGDYSVSILVDGIDSSGPRVLLGLGGGGAVELYVSNTSVSLAVGNGAGGGIVGSATLAPKATAWYMLERTGLRGFKVYRDGEEIINYTALIDSSTMIPIPSGDPYFAHKVIEHHYHNQTLTADEIKLVALGTTPVALATAGFIPTASGSFTKHSGAGSISSASATGFTMSGAGYVGLTFDRLGVAGQKVRVRFTASAASGDVYVENGSLGTTPFAAGDNVLQLAATGTASPVRVEFQLTAGVVISNFVAEAVEGTVASYRHDSVVHSGTWVDSSGNCYDLIPGSGVAALAPVESISRSIAVTVAGATVTAGTVASLGALTGATDSDTKALAAVRQWDAVSATWGQSRPANAGGVIATATAAGTVLLETPAFTSNATIAANTPVKIVHTIK